MIYLSLKDFFKNIIKMLQTVLSLAHRISQSTLARLVQLLCGFVMHKEKKVSSLFPDLTETCSFANRRVVSVEVCQEKTRFWAHLLISFSVEHDEMSVL